MSLGQNIKRFRGEAHLSQEKMAELVGVSRQAVTKWEADQSAPSTENLFRLAEVLSVTVDDLVGPELPGPSVAEQVYRLYREAEAQKAAARRVERQIRLRRTLLLIGGWLALFLLGRMLFGIKEGYTVKAWLFSWHSTVYLFGWLLRSRMYWVAMSLSAVLSAFGKIRISLCAAVGFFLGWAAGELFGPRIYHSQAGVEYHYGFATWAVFWLVGLALGVILQRKTKKNRS